MKKKYGGNVKKDRIIYKNKNALESDDLPQMKMLLNYGQEMLFSVKRFEHVKIRIVHMLFPERLRLYKPPQSHK